MNRVSRWAFSILLAGVVLAGSAGCKKGVPTAEEKPEGAAASSSAASEVEPYPLDTCIVADEKLGSMGEPYVFVHQGQELKLCCKGCLKDFNKEPAKYLQKISVKKI